MAARVEEIIESAEREADAVHRELEAHRQAAEAEAQRYVEDARRQAEGLVLARVQSIRDLTDELIARVEAVDRHFEALIAALEGAAGRLASESFDLPPMPRPPLPAPPQAAVSPQARTAPAPPRRPPPLASGPAPGPADVPPELRAAMRRPEDMGRPEEPPPPGFGPAAPGTVLPSRPPRRPRPTGPLPPAPPPQAEMIRHPGPIARRPEDAAGHAAPTEAPPRELTHPPERADSVHGDLDGARLVAIELAVSGRTRAEIDQHLRESFRITETQALLDDVFRGARRMTGRDPGPAQTGWVDH